MESAVPSGRGNTFQFAVAIPADVDLRYGINSTKISLTDEAGAAVRLNAAAYSVRAATTDRQRIARFRVSGQLPGGR